MKLNKNTKILLGVGIAALVGYLLYKQSNKNKNFVGIDGKRAQKLIANKNPMYEFQEGGVKTANSSSKVVNATTTGVCIKNPNKRRGVWVSVLTEDGRECMAASAGTCPIKAGKRGTIEESGLIC